MDTNGDAYIVYVYLIHSMRIIHVLLSITVTWEGIIFIFHENMRIE